MKNVLNSILIMLLLSFFACVQEKQGTIDKELLIGNQTIKYHVRNPDNKVSCFLVHGFGDSHKSFEHLFPVLDDLKLKIIYFDLPGMSENQKALISFPNSLELLSKLYNSEKSKNNFAIGHSLGGLMVLLSTVEYKMPFDKIITIEPSLTDADYKFFTYIQEKPTGVGISEFILNSKDTTGYLKFYNNNLKQTDTTLLKDYAKTVYDNFKNYRSKILDSKANFIYIYGNNSSGLDERKKMTDYSFVTVKSFDNAQHWVHFDAKNEFIIFLKNELIIK
jgi:pimeloyl-ACP methyl ester carboxylesterase